MDLIAVRLASAGFMCSTVAAKYDLRPLQLAICGEQSPERPFFAAGCCLSIGDMLSRGFYEGCDNADNDKGSKKQRIHVPFV